MKFFENIALVGMHFRPQGKALVAEMEEGQVLRLVREPENKYDPNAIQVFFEDSHIAYVNRDEAVWIADALDSGIAASCVVTSFEDRKNNRHPICEIMVLETEAEVTVCTEEGNFTSFHPCGPTDPDDTE